MQALAKAEGLICHTKEGLAQVKAKMLPPTARPSTPEDETTSLVARFAACKPRRRRPPFGVRSIRGSAPFYRGPRTRASHPQTAMPVYRSKKSQFAFEKHGFERGLAQSKGGIDDVFGHLLCRRCAGAAGGAGEVAGGIGEAHFRQHAESPHARGEHPQIARGIQPMRAGG